MMNLSQIRPTRAAASLAAALFAVLVWVLPALATDAIFPTGCRIGLVPPLTMPLSPHFMGFEDSDVGAAILLATFPADAFGYLDKSMVPEALKKRGIDNREPFAVAGGMGFLLSGKQTTVQTSFRKWMLVAPVGDVTALVTVRAPDQSNKYSDQVVRAALSTLAVRASIPAAERLSLLPFKVGDLAGFRIDDVLPGRALMLVHEAVGGEQSDKAPNDQNKDAAGHPIDARFLIAALPGGPNEPKDNDNFARVAFDRIGGIADVRIQDAEPLRISGQSGYQTLAKAKDAQGTDLMVVQWLRFGTGGYMQMTGIAHVDLWPEMLTRLRKVRDSVDSE
jgi:hypothetical protein